VKATQPGKISVMVVKKIPSMDSGVKGANQHLDSALTEKLAGGIVNKSASPEYRPSMKTT
jgi:hypothetical protein